MAVMTKDSLKGYFNEYLMMEFEFNHRTDDVKMELFYHLDEYAECFVDYCGHFEYDEDDDPENINIEITSMIDEWLENNSADCSFIFKRG